MSGGLWLGIVFAIATAIATNLAFLWKHRGAVAAPPVRLRRPLSSIAELFRSKWWTIGWIVAVVGWVFHVGALALTPLSLAQAVISGGFVVLAVLAERFFGFSLGRRQWAGVVVVAIGLGFLGATTGETDAGPARYSIISIAVFQSVLLVVGLLLGIVTHRAVSDHDHHAPAPPAPGDERPRTGGPAQAPVTAHETHRPHHRHAGVLLGVAAGIAFGVSDISIKALADQTLDNVGAVVSPWAATALLASLGAFYASARSLQVGEGMGVITATTAAANLVTITGGIVVFGESLGSSPLAVALRVVAFLLVIIGACLMPGPMQAAEAGAAEERRRQHRAPPRPRPRPARST